MSAQESFELASAVAAIFGLAAALVLALTAVVGTWVLFLRASDASLAATRVAISMEDLLRGQPGRAPFGSEGGFAELRQQVETLVEQQRRLQEMARNLLDASAYETGASPAALGDLQAAVSRLEGTVGQMAAHLANVVAALERQGRS